MSHEKRRIGAKDGEHYPGLFDVLEAMQHFQTEWGYLVGFEGRLRSVGGVEQLQVTVYARKPSMSGPDETVDSVLARWPTSAHRHFTALLLYLLYKLDAQLQASDALDALFSRP